MVGRKRISTQVCSPKCTDPLSLRSGRRWIDLQDPAEASAFAAGYAALLRAFPSAADGTGRGGMAPLEELAAAVRSVAQTWSRSQQQQAAAGAAATSASPPGSPAGRPAWTGRGRPRGRSKPLAAAAATRRSPLPLPPTLPSLPFLGPIEVTEDAARRRSHGNGPSESARAEPEEPWAGSAMSGQEQEPHLEMSGTSQFDDSGGADAGTESGAPDGGEPGIACWEDVGGGRRAADGGADWDGGLWGDAGPA